MSAGMAIRGVLGDEKHTQLHDAALRGDVEAVTHLISSQRYTANERGVAGWTPLHFSARYGADAVVTFLLSKGVNAELEAKTVNQDTPLHLAAEAGHVKIVRMLLDARADPNAQDSRSRTPEVRCTSPEVQAVLAANTKVKSKAPTLSISALQAALQEATNKVQQLAAHNVALEQQASEAAKEAAEIRTGMAEKAPLKALLLTCASFTDASFHRLPQVEAASSKLRSTLVANGYLEGNIVSADNATQQDMLQALVNVSKEQVCPASSTLLVYIGGHTHFDSLTKESYLVAHDSARASISTTALSMKTLAQELARSPAKRKIVLLDAMRHELPADVTSSSTPSSSDSELLGMRDSTLNAFAERLRGAIICTSCRTDQVARLSGTEAGLFVTALVEALSGGFGKDKMKTEARVQILIKTTVSSAQVTASALIEYAALAVHHQNPQQKPFHLNANALSSDFAVSFL